MAEEKKISRSTQVGVAFGSVLGFAIRAIVAAGVMGGPIGLMRFFNVPDEDQEKITHATIGLVGFFLLVELCTEKVPSDEELNGFFAGLGHAARYPIAAIRVAFCPCQQRARVSSMQTIVATARESARIGARQAIEAQDIGIRVEGMEYLPSPTDLDSLEAAVGVAARAGAIRGVNEARAPRGHSGFFADEEQERAGAAARSERSLSQDGGNNLRQPLLAGQGAEEDMGQGVGRGLVRSRSRTSQRDETLSSVAVQR